MKEQSTAGETVVSLRSDLEKLVSFSGILSFIHSIEAISPAVQRRPSEVVFVWMKLWNRKNAEISQLTTSLSSVEPIQQENALLHDQIEKLVSSFIGVYKSKLDDWDQWVPPTRRAGPLCSFSTACECSKRESESSEFAKCGEGKDSQLAKPVRPVWRALSTGDGGIWEPDGLVEQGSRTKCDLHWTAE